MSRRVFLVEDDPDIARLVATRLERSRELTVRTFARGREFLQAMEEEVPDLVILDLSLPDTDGLTLCRELRGWETTRTVPILMLTARSSEADRVTGLSLGADDYLVKPFSLAELEARVKALLRRVAWERGTPEERYEDRRLLVDGGALRVLLDGQPVHLTRREFSLLWFLISLKGRVANRQQILDGVWGLAAGVDERTVDAHIRTLRKKLGNEVVETVLGVGYRFRGWP
ncbi:MAG: response regulator transcription factor [Thermoanaerobaculum sp.]|nr:response regulator transcription factor [Thermoanaerobaculum sp.]